MNPDTPLPARTDFEPEALKNSEKLTEKTIIILCAQVDLSPTAISEVRDALASPALDWDYIISVSIRNAVMPLVARNLLRHFEDSLTRTRRDLIAKIFSLQVHRNMFLTGKLAEIVSLFNAENIPVLPFKGPLLAMHAYKDLSLRSYGDLDILVEPRNLNKAADLLIANGYKPQTTVSWLNKTRWYIGRKKDIYFANDDRTVNIELHWKLSGSHFAMPLAMQHLWKSTEPVLLAGVSMNSLGFEDLFIYLGVHGSRHAWDRLGWICDVNELINSRQDIDWEHVHSEARRMGCENAVLLALQLVEDIYGNKTKAREVFQKRGDVVLEEITADIREKLFSPINVQFNMSERYNYDLKLKERTGDRWKLHFHYLMWYLKIIVVPNEADRNLFHLPNSIKAAYYIMRPFRLVYEAILDKREKSKPI